METVQAYASAFEAKYVAAYQLNDPAHRESHFREVLGNMIKIMEDLDTGTAGMQQGKMAVAAGGSSLNMLTSVSDIHSPTSR